jgi:Cu/Ag efflux protein CusF
MKISSRFLPCVLPLLALAAALSLTACEAEPETPVEEDPAAEIEIPQGATTYTLRGRVVELPDPADPTTGLYIHHEPIDDFVNMDGEVDGMDSMTMPFAAGDGVSLGSLNAEDKVEFDLTVDWEGDPMMEVTRIERIDPGTQLEFRKARPPEG